MNTHGGRVPRRLHLAALAVCFGAALGGCDRNKSRSVVERARFGIFYGGQVQEREQIPFELDRARQIQGFCIDFREPLPRALKVSWEINRPPPAKRGAAKSSERVVETGSAEARAGQTRFEQLVPFKPGDPLGTWNVRVVVEDEVVIDRRVLVYDAQERARSMNADAGSAYQR